MREKTVLDDFVLGCATNAVSMPMNGLCLARTVNSKEETIVCIIGIGDQAEEIAKVLESQPGAFRK